MLMGIDERRHDDSASGIYVFCILIFLFHIFGGSYFFDPGSLDGHRPVLYKREISIPCNCLSISYY